MTESLTIDESPAVTFSKPRKGYFYILTRNFANDDKDVTMVALRQEGYTTVCRCSGAEMAVGIAKVENRYRVYDIPTGLLICTADDIQRCRSLAAVEKLLPTIIHRLIKFNHDHPSAMKRYVEHFQPRMACEIVVAHVEPEYQCFYNQYSILMVDYFKDEILNAGLWQGGAA